MCRLFQEPIWPIRSLIGIPRHRTSLNDRLSFRDSLLLLIVRWHVNFLMNHVDDWPFCFIFRRCCNHLCTFSRSQASRCGRSSDSPLTSGSIFQTTSSRRSAKSFRCFTTRACCKLFSSRQLFTCLSAPITIRKCLCARVCLHRKLIAQTLLNRFQLNWSLNHFRVPIH